VTRRQWLAGPVLAASVALAVSGCALPAWIPFVGSDNPRPGKSAAAVAAPVAPAESPAQSPAMLLASKTGRLPAADDVMDRVICVVNNDAITLFELEEAEAHYLYENKEQPPAGEARQALRERLLGNIIENRIQLQQAERDKIVVDDVEITDQLQEIVKKVNAKTQAEFEDALKAQGLTMDAVKKRIRDQIMVQRLTRRKVALRVSITEQEIDKYLEENRSKLEVGLAFEARHILFLPESGQGEEGWSSAQKKAKQVYALLREGQDFGELAKKYSEDPSGKDGGNLGGLKRGELAPEIEAEILKLQPGQFSAPFRSLVGYHVFKLDSKESLTGESYAQTRSQVRDILYRQKYDARLQEWIAEMKQRAIIDVRL
jgi:peptidyl-prolyl cis-trans isomerase SurA